MTRSVFNHRRGGNRTRGPLLTSDSFTRSGAIGSTDATGTLGSIAWTTVQGTWATNGTQLAPTSVIPTGAVATLNLGTPDAEIIVTHVVTDANGFGIHLRYTDESNYVVMRGDNTQCVLVKVEGGSNSTLISNFGTLGTNTIMGAVVYDNHYDVYLDGVLKGSAESSFNSSEVNFGLRGQGTSQRFDDFYAYDWSL